MPSDPQLNHRMAEAHETDLAEVNGGRKTKGSGSQWTEQADGLNSHDDPFAYRWDGKATRAKSITVTREMLAKLREQAHGERPQLGLRWYSTDLLDVAEDWIAVTAADWGETLRAARNWAAVQAATGWDTAKDVNNLVESARQAVERDQAGEPVHATIAQLRRELAAVETERDKWQDLARAAQEGRMIPPHVPALPWTVVHSVHLPGRVEKSGIYYAPDGRMQPFTVDTMRVERSLGPFNRPRLIVNDTRVADGELYVDGVLNTRVCSGDKSIEVG